MANSLYIHIPFCAKKCLYCDFYSIQYEEKLASKYLDILIKQINLQDPGFKTIYIGGGTPTVLGMQFIEKLLKNIKNISKGVIEFTIEANPESTTSDKLKLFLDYGVNRISIGVQSFDDEKLKKLGRIHYADKAVEAICAAKRNGFNNISIDLIFGAWGETMLKWRNELKKAMLMPITHISCYSLTYEKSTQIFDLLKQKKITPQSEEVTVKMYEHAISYLEKNGFPQYEISNFAKAGFECKHNLNYWQNNSYVGLGPSAVSYQSGIRMKNTPNLGKYIKMIDKGASPVIFKEKLSSCRQAKETAAIKIRTKEGINFSWFKERTGFDFMKLQENAVSLLVKQKLLGYHRINSRKTGVFLTKKGILFCDSVSMQLL